MLNQAATIRFEDLDTGQEALAIVCYDETRVTIALSHRHEGDVQVVMSKESARELRTALDLALR